LETKDLFEDLPRLKRLLVTTGTDGKPYTLTPDHISIFSKSKKNGKV
jgi:hypothetical protein